MSRPSLSFALCEAMAKAFRAAPMRKPPAVPAVPA